MNNLTFGSYISSRELGHLDEGFFDSLKQGFKSQYGSASAVPSNDQDYEKYASKALPAIQKAAGVAKKYADKLGIPLPLATSIVAAGLVGGPAAVPYAAMLYFVRKPINNMAGKAFDAGAAKLGVGQQKPIQANIVQPGQAQQAQPPVVQQQFQQPGQQAQPPVVQQQQPQSSRLILPGSRDWNGGRVNNLQRSWTSFEDYKNSRDLHEGIGSSLQKAGNWLGGKINQGEEYWKNKGADKVGGALGSVAGYTAGKTKRYSGSIANSVKSSFGALSQFASENKLAIAKAGFLMAVGAALGSGIGMATNALSGADDLASQAMDGLKSSGTVSAQDIDSVGQSMGITSQGNGHYSNSDGTTGWVNPNPGGPGTTAMGQKIVDTPAGQQVPGSQPFTPPDNRFWGSHIGEPVPGLKEPGVDTSGQMPKGRFYGDGGGRVSTKIEPLQGGRWNPETGQPMSDAEHTAMMKNSINADDLHDPSKVSDADFDAIDKGRRQMAMDMGNPDPGPMTREKYALRHAMNQKRQSILNRHPSDLVNRLRQK